MVKATVVIEYNGVPYEFEKEFCVRPIKGDLIDLSREILSIQPDSAIDIDIDFYTVTQVMIGEKKLLVTAE